MAAIQNLTEAQFKAIVDRARASDSGGSTKLDARELREILDAAKRTPSVRYAAAVANITIADLETALRDMVSGGKLTAADLQTLYDAMLSPRNAAEVGASISAEEAELLNKLLGAGDASSRWNGFWGGLFRKTEPSFELTPEARKLLTEKIAPSAAQMLAVPARTSGVKIGGQSGGMLPTGPRSPHVAAVLGANDVCDGEGARKLRIFPTNFEIENTVATGFWSDGILRAGSWMEGHLALGRLTKIPADGKLHFTLVSHPSSHNDLNWRALGRGDVNTVDVYIVRPKPNGKIRNSDGTFSPIQHPDGTYKAIRPLLSEWEMQTPGASNDAATLIKHLSAKDLRSFPAGVNDPDGKDENGEWRRHGNEDCRPGIDATLDLKALGVQPGDYIYVGISPRDPNSGNSTTGFSYSTNRAFGLYVDPKVYR